MSGSQAEVAEEVVHTLDDTVSRFVFEEGARYLSALLVASHALDARATQVATILFAAAALSAGVVGEKLSWSAFLAGASVITFAWGGVATFRVLRTDPLRLPGVEPAWWAGALPIMSGGGTFGEKDARAWAAKLQQLAIEHLADENAQRANALDGSLRLGVIGAVSVAAAALAKLLPALAKWWSENA